MLDSMRPNLWLMFFFLGLSSTVMAGQTPICIVIPKGSDQTFTSRFKEAVEKDIALTDRFVIWKGYPVDIPKNGVVVDLNGLYIPSSDNPRWSIVLISQLPSPRERGYFRIIKIDQYNFAENASVADEALEFLTDLRNQMAAK